MLIEKNSQWVQIKGHGCNDDGPQNLKDGQFHKLLFEASNKVDFDETTIGTVRVRNWYEAYDEIFRLEKAGKEDNGDEKEGKRF